MTTLHTEVLKPCPHCGNTDLKIGKSGSGLQWVYCLPCHVGKHGDTKERAISAWNTRTPQPDAAAIRKAALEEAALECESWRGIDGQGAAKHIRALSTTLVEPAIPTPSVTLVDGSDYINSPQCAKARLSAIRSETQDAPLAINGWFPIESAPKDGTRIFLYWASQDSDGTFLRDTRVIGWYSDAGWHIEDHMFPNVIRHKKIPTHWMPLPGRPAASPTQSKDA